MIRPTVGQTVHDTRNGRVGTLAAIPDPEHHLVRVAWEPPHQPATYSESTVSLAYLAYGRPTEGDEVKDDTLHIVALWSESGYHDHRFEVGLYFTVEAAKREAQAHYAATDGDPETLIWQQREGDPIWRAHVEVEGEDHPDRGDYAIYPREVWA